MQTATFHWISSFLEAQAAELGAATNTQLAYGRDLKDFDAFLARSSRDFADAARADVENYLVWCDAQGLAKSTRARRLSAIKQLYRFAFEEGLREDNPAIQISGPGQDKRLPKILSVEEVDWLGCTCGVASTRKRSTGCWTPPAPRDGTKPTGCAIPA